LPELYKALRVPYRISAILEADRRRRLRDITLAELAAPGTGHGTSPVIEQFLAGKALPGITLDIRSLFAAAE
jgi:hypothetical protein